MTSILTTEAIDMLAREVHTWIDQAGQFPGVTPALVRAKLPEFLKAMGVPTEPAVPVPATEFAKHTCRDGRGPAFGRLAPLGECPRCDQLHAGAAPREAHPAISAVARKRADEEQTLAAHRAHFAPGGPHALGVCGPVCTFGDW